LRHDDQVLVIGITEQGGHAFEVRLEHGADPDVLAYDRGYAVVHPLDANRDGSSAATPPRPRRRASTG
jgi:hypothetical protein